MTYVEHYFENLIFEGEDCYGGVNKQQLSEEVQSAVEQCAWHLLYSLFCGREDFLKACEDDYNETPVDRWISTNDRLPENSNPVLATIKNYDLWDENDKPLRFEDVVCFVNGEWMVDGEEIPKHCEVIAWQVLPELYEEKE